MSDLSVPAAVVPRFVARCPHCTSDKRQTKAGRTKYHSPRLHCTACDKDYTPQPKQQGYDAPTRKQAVALHLEGLSLRAVARIVAVNPQSGSRVLARRAIKRTFYGTDGDALPALWRTRLGCAALRFPHGS